MPNLPKKKKNRNRYLLGSLALCLLACCEGNGSVVEILKQDGTRVAVSVEIADSSEERAQGLMGRESLEEGRGMLFIFPSSTRSSFWMKNTLISLDMIFISDNQIVDIIENAVPLSEELLTPDADYNMTLEVPGGYVSRHTVQIGDAINVRDLR